MKNITRSSTTPIIGALSSRQAADPSLTASARAFHAPTPKTTAVKDVAYLRSRRPPV